MRGARKWKKDLQSIGFPNCEKLSDDKILDIIYSDKPERVELFKWIASQLSEDFHDDLPKEDLAKFFYEHSLLKKDNADDFIYARCSEAEQKNTWKVLFSLTRMKKYFSSSKTAKHHKKVTERQESESPIHISKALDLIKESDSESENIINIKEDLKREINKRSKNRKLKKEMGYRAVSTESSGKIGTSGSIEVPAQKPQMQRFKGKTNLPEFKPLFSSPDIKDFLFGYHSKQTGIFDGRIEHEALEKEYFEDHDYPRLYIPPGAPPLGKIDNDPSKYKIKMEESAPPITTDGKPHRDHSHWQYKVYNLNK